MASDISEQTIFSVGHSTHTYERFLELVRTAGITAIADVRTSPFSRHLAHFNQDTLKRDLRLDGLVYSFLGQELGGRPVGRQFYTDGIADYERMACSPAFARGLQRLLDGARKHCIALMCSEHDPLDCHRCLLVGRALAAQGVGVKHILSNGSIVDHHKTEERLLKSEGRESTDLFLSPDEQLAEAYRSRARKVAYAEQSAGSDTNVAAE